jgi:PPM family protein phosphatase
VTLRISEHAERTDAGRQRRGNEDAFYVEPPLFAVADGMGGAQAGEVASQAVVEELERGLPEGESAEAQLARAAEAANERIYKLARADRARAGMGTTVTAALVDGDEVSVAHVGDSRAYRLREGRLELLTEDHSLVAALIKQGRLTEEEAAHHPQRSIITRALGPEPGVEVETQTFPARSGDLFLLCSDGLTTMIGETEIGELLRAGPSLQDSAEALVRAANEAGGKDNITVVLFRLEGDGPSPDGADLPTREEQPTGDVPATQQHAPAPRTAAAVAPPPRREPPPRTAPLPETPPRDRTTAMRVQRERPVRFRRVRAIAIVAAIVVPIVLGAFIATRAVFFLGTNDQGIVTVFRGLPYVGPLGVKLYGRVYVSGVPAVALSRRRRKQLADHKLRSRNDALDYVRQLEKGEVAR